MTADCTRRGFLLTSAVSLVSGVLAGDTAAAPANRDFQIALDERSLKRTLASGKLVHLDVARMARQDFGLSAVAYVSTAFPQTLGGECLGAMNKRAADQEIRQLFVVVEGEGHVGDPDVELRKKAVHNHRKWIDAARELGCHSVAVDPSSTGPAGEQLQRAAEGLTALCDYAGQQHINVAVATDWGVASDGQWVADLVKRVNHSACGVLPSFASLNPVDQNPHLAKVILLAKGISATARQFDGNGRERQFDFYRIMGSVLDAGYRGYVAINYDGQELSEWEGVTATKALLEAVRNAELRKSKNST